MEITYVHIQELAIKCIKLCLGNCLRFSWECINPIEIYYLGALQIDKHKIFQFDIAILNYVLYSHKYTGLD